jgi:outer membrane protein
MTKRFCLLVLFFFSLLLSSKVMYAQEKWTLQQCIEHALKNNIQVKQSDLATRQAAINLNQGKANLLPNLNGQFQNVYNVGRTIDRFTNQFANATVQSMNLFVGSQLTLFNGLQNYNTIKQGELNLGAAKSDADQTRNDISLNVANAYLQVLLAKEIVYNSEKQLVLTNQQVARTKNLVEAGALARGNLLQAEAQAATEELNVVNAKNNLDLARLNLIQLLELTDAKSFDIASPDVPEPASSMLANDPSTIYANAVSAQPFIKGAEWRVKSAEKGLKISRGAGMPSVQLSGSIGTGYSGLSQRVIGTSAPIAVPIGVTENGIPVYTSVSQPITELTPLGQQFNDNVNKSYGISLSIPIFNNLLVHHQNELAKIRLEQAQLLLQQSKRQLQKSVEQAYTDAIAALKRFDATKKNVSALEENFKYAQQRYDAGVMNAFEYNDSKTRLNRAESELLQAKYEFTFRLKVIDFYLGRPITL